MGQRGLAESVPGRGASEGAVRAFVSPVPHLFVFLQQTSSTCCGPGIEFRDEGANDLKFFLNGDALSPEASSSHLAPGKAAGVFHPELKAV